MERKFSLGDSIAYILINIASIPVRNMPIGFALMFGRGIGMLMYWFYPRRKIIAYANLKAAFSKEKTPAEIKRILKNTYKNYGQTIMEFLRIPVMDADCFKKYVRMEKLEQVREALKKGRGLIYLTAHFGSWELSGVSSAAHGYPMYVLARPQKMVKVNSLINRFREKFGCKVINKGMATREIIKGLKNNEILGMLSDQDAGKRGTFVNFFGRPTSCATGAFNLARKTGAVSIPSFTVRVNGPYHSIEFEPAIEVSGDGDAQKEIYKKLEHFMAIQESYIRAHPEQWLWVHKRWKSTPVRKVMVLSDKKAGHINQSAAILNIFRKCRRDAGYSDGETLVKVVDVEFRSSLRKALLSFLSVFASSACQGCMWCLKFCLTDKACRELIMDYTDIVISCGSSLAAVNAFLTYENNARNIVIMKPGITGFGKFNVAIVPEHDRPPKKRNIVITKGAPVSVDKELLAQESERLKSRLGTLKSNTIGLLLGGDSDKYRISADIMAKLVSQLEHLADKLDAELLITTSRRTPKEADDYLASRFANHPRCKLLVLPNRSNIPGVVNGIMGLSRLLIVSGDSISMVSEAANSGKPVLVFNLEKKNSNTTRHERLLEELARSNVIIRTPVGQITEKAILLELESKPVRKIDDSEKIYEAVYRII